MMSSHIEVFRELTQSDILKLVAIIIGTWLLLRLNKIGFQLISKKTNVKRRYKIMSFQPISRLIILFGGIFWIFNILIEPSTQNIITILGATGLALGFAFREYISSLIAGIVTLYEGPYRPGDWIEIGEVYGEVKSIGMRAVQLLTADDVLVHIPLIKVWQSPIHNYNYGSTKLMNVTDIYIRPKQGYDVSDIKNLLYRVAISSPYTQLQRPIKITVRMEIHGYHFQIKSYPIDPRDQFRYETDLTIKTSEALQQKGIELTEFH